MKIWAKCIEDNKIRKDLVLEFNFTKTTDTSVWNEIVSSFCNQFDLSRPIILSKHILELDHFSRTVFKKSDFMDNISFDKLELEIFPEKKKDSIIFKND